MDDFMFAAGAEEPMLSWRATVTKIVDGDTFEVTWDDGYDPPDGLLDRIRISGVDTNETHTNEAFALEAKARLAELIPVGTHVRLEAQHEDSNTLNRPVRHVFVGTTNVAEVLISEGLGLAVSYDMEPGYRADYFAASEQAQVDEVGMWEPGAAGGDPNTWPTIEMVVNYDAEGDDLANLNDEYIKITNKGDVALDLSGWSARSSARLNGTTITVAAGTIIDPGESYYIHVGSGTNTSHHMYIGDTEPLFDNTGDVVYVRDTHLNIRATQLWPATITRGEEHSIVIDDVQYDAPGDDAVNPNGEWINIRNAGATTVDLTDWRIKDDGFDYKFKDGVTIAAGETMRIYVGSGTDSSNSRYWGNSLGILNNITQKLAIWTPQSLEVDSFVWGTDQSIDEDPRGAIRLFTNFDAAGDDAKNPNGEWVSLWNTSDSAINLAGYKLKSGPDTFTFAAGTTLAANANLLVKVGQGTDTSTTKFWGKTAGIFSNTSDSVDLVDTSADIILRNAWPSGASAVSDHGIVIDAVNYDAKGSDTTNANGEWLRLRNSSMAEQNLRNWQITIGNEQLNLLADRVLSPGETVMIHMGTGTNTENTIYWGKSAGIMNNDGSLPIKLYNPNREMVQYHGWGKAGSSSNQSVTAAIDMSINYDAAGDDALNPKGEWINLVNTSSSTVSLNGYHLYTDGTTYTFDAGDTIGAGERMRIHRGSGTDSGLVRYASALNEFANDADEVVLRSNVYAGTSDIFAYPATTGLMTHGDFKIIGANPDATGNDATNPNGEWIDIKNVGTTSASLRDWRIQYMTATFYDFNANVVVAAGDTIRLFMGKGTDTAAKLYWGNTSGILGNLSGSLELQSQYRQVANTFKWPGTETLGNKHSIVIDDVQYDAPGDDAVNPNGEWIKIRNAGSETVDLNSWRIKDDGFDYYFKNGDSLAAGKTMTVFIGNGTDTTTIKFWGKTTGILNNTSQKLTIITDQSVEVDSFAWGTEKSLNENPRGAIRLFTNFDAAGDDAKNPNGEWVSLWNTSDSAINLAGYKLKSGPDTFTFAAGTTLAANANLLVKVGQGTDTSTTKFWGKTAGIFSNTSDSVDLVDTSADIILRNAWPSGASAVSDHGIVIDAVNYDAKGSDTTNANGEWLRLRNSSMAEQNLRNWQITIGNEQLNLLADRVLSPGETVMIHMGTGTNTENTIYWGKSAGIMNNDGSLPIKLYNPNREMVQYHGWGKAGSSSNQSVTAAIDMSINYDAAGDDALNPKGEWINLVNTSSSTVSLNGYHLYTDGTTYTFDAGDTIGAGERMRIHRGSGTDSGLVRYASALNEFANDADEVVLRSNVYAGTSDIFAYPATTGLMTHGDFKIIGANPDATGNDATNPNGEWIDIKNVGTTSASLRDWRIQYMTATFYDFNANVVVAAGDTIRLFMGKGTDTAAKLYWGNTSGILGNLSGSLELQSQYRQVANTFKW